MEIRLSKDFADALEAAGGGVSKPTVAIVGRPNVGKSTLFNRILGGRPAIVSERPGTTRDRHFGDAEWQGRRFWVVDTGGLVPDSDDSMDRAIRQPGRVRARRVGPRGLPGGRQGGRASGGPGDRRAASAGPDGRCCSRSTSSTTWSGAQRNYEFYELGFGEPVGRERGDREGKR